MYVFENWVEENRISNFVIYLVYFVVVLAHLVDLLVVDLIVIGVGMLDVGIAEEVVASVMAHSIDRLN